MLYERRTNKKIKNLEYNGNTFYTPEGNDPSKEKVPDDPNAVYVRLYEFKLKDILLIEFLF